MKIRVAKKVARYAGKRAVRIGTVLSAGKRLSGWLYCYFGRECEIALTHLTDVDVGRVICDPHDSATIIQRSDGKLQRGGVWRVLPKVELRQ